jgi:hypothetical protein
LQTSNDCGSCHNSTKFAPAKLPFNHADAVVAAKTCFTCHDGAHKLASGTIITGKTPTHIATNNSCENCHNTSTWANAVFDHTGVVAGTCFSCHDGKKATGRSTSHIVINSPPLCDACHRSFSTWTPVAAAAVDHTQVSSTCFNCHNGTIASGKPNTHVKSSNLCATCHVTGGQPWTIYHFDHTDSVVAATACFTCHNGTVKNAQAKDAAHLNTTTLCEACHVFTAWGPLVPAKFDHTQAVGTCSACHDGTHKLGVTGTLVDHKGTSHFITTRDCSVCHTTNAWTPVLTYVHASAAYVAHTASTGVTGCASCHKQNNEKITYAQPGLVPNCAACHSTSFKPGSHPKYSSPTKMNYTFIELKDCTGACHEYTDQTLSKISKTHNTNTHHRPTFSSWN